MSITSAAEAILEMPGDESCTAEDAVAVFGETPETIRSLVEEHQALLALDGWKEPYLSFRAFRYPYDHEPLRSCTAGENESHQQQGA